MSQQEEPVFVSPEEFAQRTGLSIRTVRDMVRERRLAATKTSPGKGGRVLILASEVERLRDEATAWRVEPRPEPSPAPADDDGE